MTPSDFFGAVGFLIFLHELREGYSQQHFFPRSRFPSCTPILAEIHVGGAKKSSNRDLGST
jgi:hypothetical protein